MAGQTKNEDIYPQFFNMLVTESAANTFTQASYPTNRGRDKAWELLGAFVFVNPPDHEAGQDNRVEVQVTKRSVSSQLDAVDKDTIVHSWKVISNIVTDGSAVEAMGYWELIPLTFGGKGVLIANDNLYISVLGTGNAGAKSGRVRLIYREVKPSQQDLIGILQETSG